MATHEWFIEHTVDSNGLNSSVYMRISPEAFNEHAANNIPSNAIITDVKMSCEYKQDYSLSEGDARIYWSKSTSTEGGIQTSNVIKALRWGDGDVTTSWQRLSNTVSTKDDFYLSGENVGQIKISNVASLFFQGYSTVTRPWHIRNPLIVWEYYIPTYTITVTATTGGTVTGGGTYEAGVSVTLKATSNNGYHFVRWSDGNTNATRTVTATADITYTAYFELDKINKIYIGTSQPKSLYVGASQVKEIYRGTEKIYG